MKIIIISKSGTDKMLARLNDIRILFERLNNNTFDVFLNALKNMENGTKEDFTEDDWRSLATYQNYAGYLYKGPKEETSWHEKAIASLNHVKGLIDNDWRLLAMFYYNAGLDCKDPKLKFEFFEKAGDSLKVVAFFTSEDLRNLSDYQNNAGWTCQEPQQKMVWYEKAIDSLMRVPEFTAKDYRNLSKFQNNASIACQEPQQKMAWNEKAVDSLMHVSEFNTDDYRKLSNLQNNAGIACQGPQQKMVWYEKAIASLEHIPVEILTSDDWHKLKNYQRNIADISKDRQQKLASYEKIIASWAHIPEKEFTFADWADLARDQSETGVACQETQKRIDWFEKAMASLTHIPEKNFSYENWRSLAIYQYNIASICSDLKKKMTLVEQAISTLKYNVPEKYFTPNDWWYLALCQHVAALACTDSQKKFELYEKSLNSFQRILGRNFSQDHLRALSLCKKNYAVACKENNEWRKAESLFYSSLDSYIKLTSKEKDDYIIIAFIYDELEKLALQHTPQHQLFLFANSIFLGMSLNFSLEFLRYHREILNPFDSRHHALHRAVLQLMRLIEAGITDPNFSNQNLITWFSNPTNRLQFDKMLKEVDQAYKPLSLLNMIDQVPNFSVAVASKLAALENLIFELQKENQAIKEENKQWKSFFQTHAGSIYQSNLPIFNNHANSDPNMDTHPEQKLVNALHYTH